MGADLLLIALFSVAFAIGLTTGLFIASREAVTFKEFVKFHKEGATDALEAAATMLEKLSDMSGNEAVSKHNAKLIRDLKRQIGSE